MAEPFTPITKPLEEMTKAELFEIAQERQIPGRYDMHKDQLLKAVEEALTAPETDPAPAPGGEEGGDGDEDDGEIGELDPEDQDALNEQPEEGDGKGVEPPTNPDNPKPSAPPAADDAAAHLAKVAEQQAREKVAADRAAAHANGQLTEEDRVAILRAPKGDLKEMVDDSATPEFARVAIKAELERREAVAKHHAAKSLMKSPLKQYRITKGPSNMRYVTPSMFVTTLPIGSIVSPLAHDLAHVQAQGFEWEEVKGVEIREDQLGNQVSTAK